MNRDPAAPTTTRRAARRAFALVVAAALPFAAPPALHAQDGDGRQDVDLRDADLEGAVRLLAEAFDVSVAAGNLPDARVTVRLRGADATEAFDALASAGGLRIERRGKVLHLVAASGTDRATGDSVAPADLTVHRLVHGPTASEAATLERLFSALSIRAESVGGDTWVLHGESGAVAAAADLMKERLAASRDGLLEERVHSLGVAPGEDSLAAVQALLDTNIESALYDEQAHRLVVTALPATHERIDSLVSELAREPVLFEIEVRVVEVTRESLERIGAQGTVGLGLTGGLLPTTFPLSGIGDGASFLPSAADLALLGSVGGSTMTSSAPGSLTDSGFQFGSVDARGMTFVVEALERTGEAKIVATPRVTAVDNHEALFEMVTTLRIPTFTQNDAFATTTVSGIEEIDVGTTLKVRARKDRGGAILLDVSPEVSELEALLSQASSGSDLAPDLPIVSRRRTETRVLLEGNETLIIGGLVRDRSTETTNGVPGLRDLPLVGDAFTHDGSESRNSELIVFLTPRELPPVRERRRSVRVDDRWLRADLGTALLAARTRAASSDPAERVLALADLEALDADLLAADLDVEIDVLRLGRDEDRAVRAAAAAFAARRRPATFLALLQAFSAPRQAAADVLEADLAPHHRLALGDLVSDRASSVDGASALGWCRRPVAARVEGGETARHGVDAALTILERRAPDLRQLVGHAFGTIRIGGEHRFVDAATRTLILPALDDNPERTAHLLVRLATGVFEQRIEGRPIGSRPSASALRTELWALGRITGSSVSDAEAERVVRSVLAGEGGTR